MADAAMVLEKSTTSDKGQTQGKECVLGVFMTEAEGWKVVEAAKEWVGTPYKLIGANSRIGFGGDCSGTTNKSFVAAGFSYPYQSTRSFVDYATKSLRFRKIDTRKQPMQAGDVLLWPGHMAIYAPFPEGDPRRDTGVVLRGKKCQTICTQPLTTVPAYPIPPITFRPSVATLTLSTVI